MFTVNCRENTGFTDDCCVNIVVNGPCLKIAVFPDICCDSTWFTSSGDARTDVADSDRVATLRTVCGS